jgi:solute:Na+ symporter, SSS family
MLWLVMLYLLFSIGVGLYGASKVHTAKDFITAGRNMPMIVVIAMVFATWFGAETVLGVSATFLQEDLRGLVSDPLGAGMCLIVFGLIFARPLYRMGLTTLGDFFRVRYNRSTELLLSLCIVVSYLGWVSAQITALGLVFNVLSHGSISQEAGMLIGATVVAVYTVYGGMWSVAMTTFVQMIVIIIGLFIVTGYAAEQAGGFSTVIEHAAQANKFDFWPRADMLDIIAWVAAFLTMALGSVPQQDVFQRVNSARTETAAVWGTTIGGITYLVFAAVPLFLAYSAVMIDPAMVEKFMKLDPQLILPTLVLDHMPFAMQVIFFGALISVIMSTASGTLLAPSVTFTENVLKSFLPGLTDKQFLWSTRATVLVFTVIVTTYAMRTGDSIHKMVENAYQITLAGAFVPLVAGIFWRRASNLGSGLSIFFGLSTWIVLSVTGINDPVPPQLIGLCAGIVGMILGTYLSPRRLTESNAPPEARAA